MARAPPAAVLALIATSMWVLSLVLAVLAAALLLRYYAEAGTRLYVLVPVGISWSLGFFFFLVLPFDLENAFCRMCHELRPEGPCTCLAGSAGMGMEALNSLIPGAYTCAAAAAAHPHAHTLAP